MKIGILGTGVVGKTLASKLVELGQYPANPRALNVEANVEVHVNEQSIVSLRRYLERAGFVHVKVWLNSPPQQRSENVIFRGVRHVLFKWIPFKWFL